MAQERVLKLGICGFPYGGVGASSSEHPDIRHWMWKAMRFAAKDARISEEVWIKDFSDTPITMTRNRAVVEAREAGVDVLVMVDSDMKPDSELGYDPEAKPWFPTSFDFIYKHWDKGPAVVCAPYCGPPPNECVYVFHWATTETDGQNATYKMEMYSRETAATMSGIQPCAAQPTGLIMFDMRAFDLTDPKKLGTGNGWFYYEWNDEYASEKASTEDVTATRDISMHGLLELGYSPIYCNWDSWAGHWKPKCVRKPRVIFADQIGEKYRRAAIRNAQSTKRREYVNFTAEETPERKFTFNTDETHVDNEPEHLGKSEYKIERVGGMYTPAVDLAAIEQIAKDVGSECKYRPLFLEVGSWVGESALALNRGCPEAQITCIDTWEGTDNDVTSIHVKRHGGDAVLEAFKKNTADKPIDFVQAESVSLAKSWAPRATPRDLVFIDANHSYEAVKADIEAWLPVVKPGGVMAFHDYRTSTFPGVTKAIHEAFGEENVNWDGRAAVCWVRKRAETT